MGASATYSNRRVRTRTHGGVAGVSGRPLPLCQSRSIISRSMGFAPMDADHLGRSLIIDLHHGALEFRL